MSVGQKISQMGLTTSLANEDLLTAVDVSSVLNIRITYASLLAQLTTDMPSGSGDVIKVGTPVDNQIGVWTGDGTIEGTAEFTYANGFVALINSTGSTVYQSYTSSATSSATFRSNNSTGELIDISSHGGSFVGSIMGISAADTLGITAQGLLNISTSNNNNLRIGTNDTLSATIDGITQDWDFNGNDIHNVNEFYIGEKDTDGSWRFVQSGDDLLIQQREAGTYNTKSTISGA